MRLITATSDTDSIVPLHEKVAFVGSALAAAETGAAAGLVIDSLLSALLCCPFPHAISIPPTAIPINIFVAESFILLYVIIIFNSQFPQ
jgi:hypothetical protein